jgi:pyruvate dehydrogenase E1 component beta subunit
VSAITVRDALRAALDEEMARDDAVILIGEEVGEYNGAYKVSQGLLDKYGPKRVIDTPISEEGFTGIGIGAAMAGLRPIVEWMTFNFSLQAFDQVVLPIVFRGPNGPAEALGSQHSQALQSLYAHVPGLKVAAPSNAADAKGLLKSAIRDNDPVIFLESELMYNWKGEVPDGEHLVPLGEATVARPGKDVTILGYAKPMRIVLEAADALAKQGVEAEVIDLRSLRPLDTRTIFSSVRKTNRCVVVDEAWPFASVGSHVAWLVSRACFDELDAPVELVSGEDVPMPYAKRLELAAQPSVDKVVTAVRRALYLGNGG